MTDTATLITQLRVLAHLTRTEAQVARLRVAQATADDVRDELRGNATDADARAARIADTLRDLGALPDPVAPVLGRVAALVRGALEQAQPLDEALLGDLVLEHQLHDRARYVAALADAAGLPAVRALADDLVASHRETVQWLDGVLTDLAGGQRAALNASPLQRVAAQVTRAANAPGRAALDEVGATVTHTVDRAVGTVTQAGAAVEEYAGRAARLGTGVAGSAVAAGQDALSTGRDAAVQVAGSAVAAGQDALAAGRDAAGTVVAVGQGAVTAGRDAAVQAAGRLTGRTAETYADAPDATAPDTTAPDTTAPDTTAPDPDATAPDTTDTDTHPATPDAAPAPTGPPIPGFAELSAQAAVAALRTLDDPADVAAVLAFEQAHGNRHGVLAAARVRAAAVRAR